MEKLCKKKKKNSKIICKKVSFVYKIYRLKLKLILEMLDQIAILKIVEIVPSHLDSPSLTYHIL